MRLIAILFTALLAGCGALPQPFFGSPGRLGSRLAEPPPSRLSIQDPSGSLLDDAGTQAWATATAEALANLALPAVHGAARSGDWTLDLSARVRGAQVIPSYTVRDSRGRSQGTAEGAPIAAARWSSGDKAVFTAAAEQAAPAIDALLTSIQAARLHQDPNSLQNRPARVYLTGVAGAPGDGNASLAAQMRIKLADKGIVVQDTADGADYRLRCEVHIALAAAGQLKVELQWVVDDARGERGRVVQLNEVPAPQIEHYWGDIAVAASEEAAGGIKDVLFNAAGPRLPAEQGK